MTSYDKQNGLPDGRLFASPGNSSRLSAKGTPLAKLAAPLRGDNRVESGGSRAHGGCSEEEVVTPVKTFLSSNITPRSGSRKARAESPSSTPNGTPKGVLSASKPALSVERREKHGEDAQTPNRLSHQGIRSPNLGRSSRSGSVISDGPGSSLPAGRPVERIDPAINRKSRENSPMFFHANDIQPSALTKSPIERPGVKGWVPGYAESRENTPNGRTTDITRHSSTDEQRPKFFFASEAAELKPTPTRPTNNISSNRPPLQTIYSAHPVASPNRPPSPLKEEVILSKLPISKANGRGHARVLSNGSTESKSPDAVSNRQSNVARRSSINSRTSIRASAHARSSSVHSAGPAASRRSSIAHSDTSPIEKTKTTSAVGSSGTLPISTQDKPTSLSQPQSPTKPQSRLDHMNELAANARRERKVLDLEISNSSLLAINRTLEREMRKQNAELRRFRRLSRSGRLSLIPTSRAASGKYSIFSETDTALESEGPLSPSDSDKDEDGDDNSSNLTSDSNKSHPSSPNRAAQSRFQDPRPIHLDITAHRALLLDSQRLNQCIKRCLSHTESLITSGKYALEYRPKTFEAENLGPKVLTPDELDDDILEQGRGLLSPSIEGPSRANPFERSLSQIASLDHGIETPDFFNWDVSTEGPPPPVSSPHVSKVVDDLIQAGLLPEPPERSDLHVSTRSLDGLSSETISPLPLPSDDDDSMPPPPSPRRSQPELSHSPNDNYKDPDPDTVPSPPAIDQSENQPPTSSSISSPHPDDPPAALTTQGNRSSMQNIGQFLQSSFGIFGAS